jgi:hypothetical protein
VYAFAPFEYVKNASSKRDLYVFIFASELDTFRAAHVYTAGMTTALWPSPLNSIPYSQETPIRSSPSGYNIIIQPSHNQHIPSSCHPLHYKRTAAHPTTKTNNA